MQKTSTDISSMEVLFMQPRCFLLLADNPLTLAQLRAEIEDLGEETRCQTALTAEEALFRLSQESVDAVLLLPCPAADCLTQSLLRHPPLAPPFLLGGLDGRLPEISQLPAWFSVLRLPALAAAHLPECTELARQLLTALGDAADTPGVGIPAGNGALTVVHPPLLTDVTHGLYPLMARRAQLTPCAVERRLRLAIESTWNRGDYDAIARFFGQSVDPERGKPTNREFLCQLQERLTLSARRMERRVG